MTLQHEPPTATRYGITTLAVVAVAVAVILADAAVTATPLAVS
nr:MAG TPA: hypothetical protein [Caudoviricetes sp.]